MKIPRPLRHRSPIATSIWLILGLVIAGMLFIPGLNFIAPIIGAAAATHLVQGRLRED